MNIAIELNFTPEQRVLILQERVRMLEKLRRRALATFAHAAGCLRNLMVGQVVTTQISICRIYEERRQLNMDALQALMAPPLSGSPGSELSEANKAHLTQVC